jgi:hypothetical protein
MDHDREYSNRPKARSKPIAARFRDNTNKALEDRRHQGIKNKLLEEVEREQFEEYRKSDEFIKSCKNKKTRKFYESQNDALNDWLEVDTAVRFIADDIFESLILMRIMVVYPRADVLCRTMERMWGRFYQMKRREKDRKRIEGRSRRSMYNHTYFTAESRVLT